MTNIWEQFDNNTNLEDFEEAVKAAEQNTGDFEDLAYGKYEVALDHVELKPTKKTGAPMIVSVFKVIAGAGKGRLIWVNQVVDTPMKMNIGLSFLNSMKPSEKIAFTKDGGMSKLATDLGIVADDIKANREFVLDFFKNDKGYDTHKIEEVFILED